MGLMVKCLHLKLETILCGSTVSKHHRMIVDIENDVIVDSKGRIQPRRSDGPKAYRSLGIFTMARDLFLPVGYPLSVTPDYLQFQIYDSIQGLSSYIRGMLSNQSVLLGLGFSRENSSLFSASVSIAAKEAVSTASSLLICSKSSSFDSHSKQWRLAADICNDLALSLQILSSFSQSNETFLGLFMLGAMCQAVTGVAGSSTRMALTQHFALHQNAANVSACESAQEIAITLIGLVFGLLLTKLSESFHTAALVCFIFLTYVHVHANIRAMRCLRITRLNDHRLSCLFHAWVQDKEVLGPEKVAQMEPLFLGIFNKPVEVVIAPNLNRVEKNVVKSLVKTFRDPSKKFYIIPSEKKAKRVYVFLTDACKSGQDLIEAYVGALCEVKYIGMREKIAAFMQELEESEWITDSVLLNQGSSRLSARKTE
jgi:hypothetical protein